MPTDPFVLTPASWSPAAPLRAIELGPHLARLLQAQADAGLAPVHLRLYSTAGAADQAVAQARGVLGEAPCVVSVVTATPCAGGEVGGVHLLSAPAGVPRAPVLDGDRTLGVRLGDDAPVVVLAGLTTPADGPADAEFAALFDRAEALLADHGLAFGQVARTWLHLPALLRDYDALNRARSAFFAARGIGRDVAPPASTGIQGGARDGARMQMDLVATTTDRFRPMVANLQCEAWEYGSAFSRGMALGSDLVTVSGTASIDADGRTIHLDDATEQIRATWATVGKLLAAEELTLPPSGAQAWVLYFKTPAVWDAWRRLAEAGEVSVPDDAVCVFADVCRDDLLFEMELTAAR